MVDSPEPPAASAGHSDLGARLPGRAREWSIDGDAILGWTLPFLAVLYLGLKNGGYDTVVYGQVGIVVWWAVLLVAVVGLVPRLNVVGWVAVGLLAAIALWTAIGIGGSESHERTLAEVGRVSTYAGVLLLALVVQARAGSRHVLNGLASAIGVITVLAVLSRLHPQWFPANDQIEFLDTASRRLSYPLNYWNALAAFMALGSVLLLAVTFTARTLPGRFLAAASLPLACLGVYLCVSRGGAIVFVIGVAAYLVLVDDRLPKLLSVIVAGAGGGILILFASHRDAVQSGIDSAAARSEGMQMIWLCLVVCLIAGLVQVLVVQGAQHEARPDWSRISRRHATIATAIALPVVILALAIGGAGGAASDRWDSFKTPPDVAGDVTDANVFARLQDSAGQGRYQFWEQAVDAYKSNKLSGTGGATFAFWWSRHATVGGPVQDAHDLYLQTLAELGLVGAILLLGFVGLTLVEGTRRTIRATGEGRILLAAATAGVLIFWVDASVEWVWQLAVMPVAMLTLVGVILGTARRSTETETNVPLRVALGAVALLALVPVAIATTEAAKIHQSQAAARDGNLKDALSKAQTAARIEPGAATPRLQQALVLEQAGQLKAALPLLAEAIRLEPTNWKLWIVRARVEARLGNDAAALAAFRKARSLNPKSEVFLR